MKKPAASTYSGENIHTKHLNMYNIIVNKAALYFDGIPVYQVTHVLVALQNIILI